MPKVKYENLDLIAQRLVDRLPFRVLEARALASDWLIIKYNLRVATDQVNHLKRELACIESVAMEAIGDQSKSNVAVGVIATLARNAIKNEQTQVRQ